jgi:hypothetical protein
MNKDLSAGIQRYGDHYIAIGDHAALWGESLLTDSGKVSPILDFFEMRYIGNRFSF